MTVSGDFMAEEGAELVVNLEKVSESDEIIMNVQFMDGDVVVAGGDYFVPLVFRTTLSSRSTSRLATR